MHGLVRKSHEPVRAGTADAHRDLDMAAWLRALREIPSGTVTEADFLAWLDEPLRPFFPFEKFFGAFRSVEDQSLIVYGPVSIPLTGRAVRDWAKVAQRTVIGPGRETSPAMIGGRTQREP